MGSWSFRQIVVTVSRGEPDIPPAYERPPATPPKHFPPPPRAVRRRAGWGETIALRLLLVGALVFWVVLGVNVAEHVWLHAFGQQIQGRANALRKFDRHKGASYYVAFH